MNSWKMGMHGAKFICIHPGGQVFSENVERNNNLEISLNNKNGFSPTSWLVKENCPHLREKHRKRNALKREAIFSYSEKVNKTFRKEFNTER